MKKIYTGYIMFPLCTFSLRVPLKALSQYLIDYSIVHKAKNIFSGYNFDDYEPEYPEDYKERIGDNRLIKSLIMSAEERNLKIVSYKKTIRHYKVINNHLHKFEDKFGNDTYVRIKLQLLMDVVFKKTLKEEDFKVLCAIYSCLGSKNLTRSIENKEIGYRILGYKIENPAIDKKTLISNKKLRRIIPLLIQRGFFDRKRNGRKYTYSKPLRGKALQDFVNDNSCLGIIDREIERRSIENHKKFKKKFAEKIKKLTMDELEKLRKEKKNKNGDNKNL